MRKRTVMLAAGFCLAAMGCSDSDDIDSDTEARWAYLGFDQAIDRAMGLGFDGYNEATSANIPPQAADGDETGTMTLDGQVDQGASANKEMRLLITVTDYYDGSVTDTETDADITVGYDNTEQPAPLSLDMSLKGIPDGDFTGTLTGTATVSGDVDGDATFDLSLAGDLEETGGGDVIRSPGSVTVTGTVTSGDGIYNVNTTL